LHFISVRPEVLIGSRVNQLNRQAHPVGRLYHRALDQGVNAQFVCHLGSSLVPTRGNRGRGMRDHVKRTDLGQVRDELIGYAVGKELLIWIGRKIYKRKDGNGSYRVRAQEVPRRQSGNK